jgi:hypothetical protein
LCKDSYTSINACIIFTTGTCGVSTVVSHTSYESRVELNEHSRSCFVMFAGMAGYFNTGAGQGGQQPSNYSTTWPGADPCGEYPTINPQNYSREGMPPAIAMYSAASIPILVQSFQPTTPATPFGAWNYLLPKPAAGPFDARNHCPPGSTPMPATYEPRMSKSTFNNSMQPYGGGVTSPIVLLASYLLSPVLSSSSSGGSSPCSI